MHAACNVCGNAYPECECAERTQAQCEQTFADVLAAQWEADKRRYYGERNAHVRRR